MKLAITGIALLVMACATVSPNEGSAAPGCRVEGLQDLTGRPATSELGAEALRRSGARRLRWIRPGDVVTMDYSAERLNVHVDAASRVERFACG